MTILAVPAPSVACDPTEADLAHLPTLQRGPVFSVEVKSEDFKFGCGHFVAFKGFRERLHGHNYTVEVHLIGTRLSHDGYVLDFGDLKAVTKKSCKELNEYVLLPGCSDVIKIGEESRNGNENWTLTCEDGSFFSLPKEDCKVLPIVHSTAEEIAQYLWHQILTRLGGPDFLFFKRGVTEMVVFVAERVTQRASYRAKVVPELVPKVVSQAQTMGLVMQPVLQKDDVSHELKSVLLQKLGAGLKEANKKETKVLVELADIKVETKSGNKSGNESIDAVSIAASGGRASSTTGVGASTDPRSSSSEGSQHSFDGPTPVEKSPVETSPVDTSVSKTEKIKAGPPKQPSQSAPSTLSNSSTLSTQSISMSQKEHEMRSRIEPLVRELLTVLGADVNREGLVKTPLRSAKAWLELTAGYRTTLGTIVNEAVFDLAEEDEVVCEEIRAGFDGGVIAGSAYPRSNNRMSNYRVPPIPIEGQHGPIVLQDIPFSSLCEHHLLPFTGKIHVGILVGGKVLGLSKIPRICDMFARRLQLQERMTRQIAEAIEMAFEVERDITDAPSNIVNDQPTSQPPPFPMLAGSRNRTASFGLSTKESKESKHSGGFSGGPVSKDATQLTASKEKTSNDSSNDSSRGEMNEAGLPLLPADASNSGSNDNRCPENSSNSGDSNGLGIPMTLRTHWDSNALDSNDPHSVSNMAISDGPPAGGLGKDMPPFGLTGYQCDCGEESSPSSTGKRHGKREIARKDKNEPGTLRDKNVLGVAVLVTDTFHHCMCSRGANKVGVRTTTSFFTGEFKEDAAKRAEFMMMVAGVNRF